MAEMKGAVDHRVYHRVGHAEEEYPGDVARIDAVGIEERVDDEDDLIRRPADNEGDDDERRQTNRPDLRLVEELSARRRIVR